MIAGAEQLGDMSQADSLRVLLRHFESELAQLQASKARDGVGPDSAHRGSPAAEQPASVDPEDDT
jgi:hypothetical protein